MSVGNRMYLYRPDGGFAAVDLDTRLTAYAYPTSPYANAAKRNPIKVAVAMLDNERMSYRTSDSVLENDDSWIEELLSDPSAVRFE